MKPEDQARQDIDRQLAACGWIVQDRQSMNIHAGPGVAVREFPVVKPDGKRGSVDYLLYAGARAIAVVEAKPRGLDPSRGAGACSPSTGPKSCSGWWPRISSSATGSGTCPCWSPGSCGRSRWRRSKPKSDPYPPTGRAR